MHFGVVGDVHGEFDALLRVMARHAHVRFWLSVGDVASDDMRYPEPPAPLYWIQGNNEDFSFIAGLRTGSSRPHNLHFLQNGTRTAIDSITVAALGGTFAPTWYETPAAALPFPGRPPAQIRSGTPATDRSAAGQGFGVVRPVRDDKRRHFVREQVEALAALGRAEVLLTHEAPRPFIVQAGLRRLDAGKTVINELLSAVRPRLHFFGHHHRFSEALRQGVRSIGLDVVSRSHVIVDSDSWEVERVETPELGESSA